MDSSDQHPNDGAASRSSAGCIISDGGRLNPKPRSSTIVLRALCLDLQELNLKHQSIVPGDERRRPPLAVPYTAHQRQGGDQRQGTARSVDVNSATRGIRRDSSNLGDQRSRGRWAWRSPSLLGTTRRRISPAHILYQRRHREQHAAQNELDVVPQETRNHRGATTHIKLRRDLERWWATERYEGGPSTAPHQSHHTTS